MPWDLIHQATLFLGHPYSKYFLASPRATQKSNKRSMAGTIKEETKREGQRKTKRGTTLGNQGKGRELVPLVVGGNLTQGYIPYYTHQALILHISKGHVHLKKKKGWFGAERGKKKTLFLDVCSSSVSCFFSIF